MISSTFYLKKYFEMQKVFPIRMNNEKVGDITTQLVCKSVFKKLWAHSFLRKNN